MISTATTEMKTRMFDPITGMLASCGNAETIAALPANIPVIGSNILVFISVVAVLIMCYINLRGIREAGRAFALPTYLFSVSVAAMIVFGLAREVFGGGLPMVGKYPGPIYAFGHNTQSLISVG